MTGLSLASNGLSGTIPGKMEDLRNLETLYLSGNSLSGCMPAGLYEAATHDLDEAGIPSCAERQALEALYSATDGENWTDNANWLSEEPLNRWYGVVADRSGRVTQLLLQLNDLSGQIPAELSDLRFLRVVWLYDNALTGTIPSELGRLTNLLDLRMSDNRLTGTIPTELGALTNLSSLRLGGNQLQGNIPMALGNRTSLTYLHLQNNELTGTIPQALGDLPKLVSVLLGGNRFSGCVPAGLYSVSEFTAPSDLSACSAQ